MAIVTYTISWTPTPGSFGTLLEYKKKTDSVWTVPNTTPNPTLFSSYDLSIDNSFDYDIRISANGGNCTKKYRYSEIINGTDPVDYIWIPDSILCEESLTYVIDTIYSNFSSPYLVYYYAANGRCYVADADRAAGNAYWFDPDTFTGVGDITSIAGLTTNIYNAQPDDVYNRLYFIGLNSGGLKSLSLATETYTTVTCGVDGVTFNRIPLYIGSSTIYTIDLSEQDLYLIDRSSLVLVNTLDIPSIPSGTTYVGITGNDRTFIQVGNEIWTCAGFSTTSFIGVYNTSFTTLITTLAVPSAAVVGGGFEGGGDIRYRQAIAYDSANNRVYVSDWGSSKLHVYNAITRAVIETKSFTNLQGKLLSGISIVIEKVSGDWFVSYRGLNTVSDGSPYLRTYKLNRTNSALEYMVTGSALSDLSSQTGTNQAWAANAGLTEWSGGAWATDGVIYKLTK